MPTHELKAANGVTAPSTLSGTIKIEAPPKTDIWRRGVTPEGDVFDAPYIYITIRSSDSKRLAVTVTVPWKTQFDQGGLLLAWPRSDGPWRWVKAGIEYFDGKPALGVVGTDRFSDWSLAPMPEGDQRTARFEAVRDGTTLWVYLLVNGESRALREVKWAFLDEKDGDEMRVGIYAAKPTPDEDDAEAVVEASFDAFELEVENR